MRYLALVAFRVPAEGSAREQSSTTTKRPVATRRSAKSTYSKRGPLGVPPMNAEGEANQVMACTCTCTFNDTAHSLGGGRTCCESIWSSVGHPVIPVPCSWADVGSTCRRASAAANLRAVGSGPSITSAGTRPGAVGAGVGTAGSGTGAGAELKSVVAVAELPASKSPKSCECNRATHNERLHSHAGWLWSLLRTSSAFTADEAGVFATANPPKPSSSSRV